MKTLIAVFIGFFALFSSYAHAQVPPPPPMPRSITVSGEAEEQISPDQAVLNISLVSKDVNLVKAKQENDELVAKLMAVIHNYNIPKEKVSTSNVNISPQYSYDNGKQRFESYDVNRSLRIIIDKIDDSERILAAIIEAKIDQINGLEFQLADPEAHSNNVRVKAFENAKAKAQTLATAAGVKLGAPLSISTVDAPSPPIFRPMPMMKAMSAAAPVPQELPGMITLHESVTVSFELQ